MFQDGIKRYKKQRILIAVNGIFSSYWSDLKGDAKNLTEYSMSTDIH